MIRAYTNCRISEHEIYHESETLVSYTPMLITPDGVTDVITATGDINNKEIQKQILEIFECDKFDLLEKRRKLGRILE